MVFVQISGHDPFDLNFLCCLIDLALHQLKRHCLHNEELDVANLDVADACDVRETDAPVVFTKRKNVL